MAYLTVKSLHIFVAVLWIGSLVLVSYVHSVAGMDSSQLRRAIRITDAAIGSTWLFGLVLVILGGWYVSAWLYVKIVFVVVVSAIHTFAHRRWKQDKPEQTHPFLPYAVAVFSFLIILVVVFKQPSW